MLLNTICIKDPLKDLKVLFLTRSDKVRRSGGLDLQISQLSLSIPPSEL